MTVPSVTTASPGGYANPLKLDTDRYKRQQNARRAAPKQAASRPAGCSADAMPAAERRRNEAEYARLFRTQGRAAADRYGRQQGALFYERLVAQGVCPPRGRAAPAKTASSARTQSKASGKTGRKCTKTTMQARNIANPGGGAMTMIMVPVCVN